MELSQWELMNAEVRNFRLFRRVGRKLLHGPTLQCETPSHLTSPPLRHPMHSENALLTIQRNYSTSIPALPLVPEHVLLSHPPSALIALRGRDPRALKLDKHRNSLQRTLLSLHVVISYSELEDGR